MPTSIDNITLKMARRVQSDSSVRGRFEAASTFRAAMHHWCNSVPKKQPSKGDSSRPSVSICRAIRARPRPTRAGTALSTLPARSAAPKHWPTLAQTIGTNRRHRQHDSAGPQTGLAMSSCRLSTLPLTPGVWCGIHFVEMPGSKSAVAARAG